MDTRPCSDFSGNCLGRESDEKGVTDHLTSCGLEYVKAQNFKPQGQYLILHSLYIFKLYSFMEDTFHTNKVPLSS